MGRQERSGGANRAELGLYLKGARERCYVDGRPMTRKYVVTHPSIKPFKIPEHTLLRIETGQSRIRTKPVLKALIELYGIDDPEQQERVMELWSKDRSNEDWTTAFRPVMSPSMTAFVGLEADAESINLYHPAIVHGLLQHEDYAKALYEAEQHVADTTNAFIRTHVELRAERKRRVLQRQPKPVYIRAILSEAALRARVGGENIMRKQWAELAMLSRLPHVSIQVLPLNSGGYRATHDFAVLNLRKPLRPMVQSDTAWGALSTSDKPAQIERFARAFSTMSSSALAPEETPEYLYKLRNEGVTP